MKRTLRDFLDGELLFEHLRTIYRHYLDTGGYERAEMVDELAEFLESPTARARLVEHLGPEETELLYVLRLVGGIAPREWLFAELANRSSLDEAEWTRAFRRLRRNHLVFLIGSDTAYLPEGIAGLIEAHIAGQPPRLSADVIPGASAVRQSVHGLVIALLGYIHQNPPRVMAEEERIWKRDLEGMADFFHSYLAESGAGGETSLAGVRGRVSRLVEMLRKMGFLEKRGKRLYLDTKNWADWSERSEVDRHSLFLSFLKDHYENIPVCLEALVDWREAQWVPLDRLTEAVRYRALRGTFHILRVRPQAEVSAEGPGRRWVSACVHLLADLGLVYTGSDPDGEPVAAATDGAVEAWEMLNGARVRRRRKANSKARAYAQPNFELLLPEECPAELHREIGSIARLRSLDRFWTYVLSPESVARGVEEGLTAADALARLDAAVEGTVPPNVREAVTGWARTAWWVDADGNGGSYLSAESRLFDSLREVGGVEEFFRVDPPKLVPEVSREEAERWLEERGVRVVPEDRDPPGEFGRSPREAYLKILDAWQRRVDHSGEGTPHGSYWDDVIPVQPLPGPGPA